MTSSVGAEQMRAADLDAVMAIELGAGEYFSPTVNFHLTFDGLFNVSPQDYLSDQREEPLLCGSP